jgi:hypothetical protein
MTTVVCSTSIASAFNVVLNLVCVWLLLIVMADFTQDQGRRKALLAVGRVRRPVLGLRATIYFR